MKNFAPCALATLFVAAGTGFAPAEPLPPPSDFGPKSKCLTNQFYPVFILRSDFTNFGLLNCDEDQLTTDQGAVASAKHDYLTGNNSFSIDGVAAAALRYFPEITSNFGLGGFQVGPYVQGDGTWQLPLHGAPVKTSDAVTAGAFTEFGLLDGPVFQHWFRFHGGESSGSTGSTSNTGVGEWLPVAFLGPGFVVGAPNPSVTNPLVWEIDPEVMAQYDDLTGGKSTAAIFHTDPRALRVGPQVVLRFSFNAQAANPAGLPLDLLSKLLFTTSFHASWDTYSSRNYSTYSATVTYNITKNFGISANYMTGANEGTGNKAQQIKAGLSAKF